MYANDLPQNIPTDFDLLLAQLGREFGVLAESDTYQLTVIAHNTDVAVGDLFLLPSRRGHRDRVRESSSTNVRQLDSPPNLGDRVPIPPVSPSLAVRVTSTTQKSPCLGVMPQRSTTA